MAKASQVVLSENEFYLIKAPNGKVLEVKNFNTENGAAIRLWDYAGHPWQQWKFVDAGEGRWRIQNRFTGKMMDLALGGVVVSVNTCANLVGRLSFGQIIDKLGAYKSLLISLVVTIVALVIMSMSFTQSMFFVALALLGFSFGALLVIYPPLTGGAFGTSNIGVNYGIMFLGYAASTWISQPITAVLYHAEAGSAAYQQSFYGAIVIAAIAVVLTVYMMVSDSKKKSA
mgnify:CR=1 FL=1